MLLCGYQDKANSRLHLSFTRSADPPAYRSHLGLGILPGPEGACKHFAGIQAIVRPHLQVLRHDELPDEEL